MAPIIKVSNEDLEAFNPLGMEYILREGSKPAETRDSFIYVPSRKLEIAKERTHYSKNWFQTHDALKNEGSRMLTPSEFVNFLNYLRENPSGENNEIFNDITQVRSPGRAEWLDAYFEKREDGLWILTGNKTKAEKLEACLMKNRIPGISLDNWLKNPTYQGLPRSKISQGELYYGCPRSGGVAGFLADSDGALLIYLRDPDSGDSVLGVRAVKQRK